MRRMTEGDMPMAPIPVARQDEIGVLISNFNRFVAELTGDPSQNSRSRRYRSYDSSTYLLE